MQSKTAILPRCVFMNMKFLFWPVFTLLWKTRCIDFKTWKWNFLSLLCSVEWFKGHWSQWKDSHWFQSVQDEPCVIYNSQCLLFYWHTNFFWRMKCKVGGALSLLFILYFKIQWKRKYFTFCILLVRLLYPRTFWGLKLFTFRNVSKKYVI